MNPLTKSNQKEGQLKLAAPVRRQENEIRPVSVIAPVLRHLNTGTLAFVMFVALAVLSTTRGKDADNTRSTPAEQGYLQVYSATDEFNDDGTPYYAHSSYAIYTMDGKLFKNIENHISRSDEIPELVTLPVGSYAIEARSESSGYVRIRVIVKARRLTILDLDLGEKQTVAHLVVS